MPVQHEPYWNMTLPPCLLLRQIGVEAPKLGLALVMHNRAVLGWRRQKVEGLMRGVIMIVIVSDHLLRV